ncbi:MAG: universal stress protein [Gammaproteobacteria bacterium]|nr:universal stress protein [Gammaproteobacteria bacterium]
MSIKRVLVHLDDSTVCDDRLRTSMLLAHTFNAEINGVFIEKDQAALAMPATASMAENPALVQSEMERFQELNRESKQHIADKISSLESPVFNELPWQAEQGDVREILSELGLFNDLIVMTNSVDNDPLLTIKPLATDIAVHTSCPVLVVPKGKPLKAPLRNTFVCWNGTVEASRAIQQSIPFLKSSYLVTLFCYRDNSTSLHHYANSQQHMLEYLRAHHINVNLIDDQEPMEQDDILKRIYQLGKKEPFELLIIGAYDHSNIRELLFSSPTKQILKAESFPVLLSH